jgi:hypothetical protein
MVDWLGARTVNPSDIVVAVEVPHGPVVEALMAIVSSQPASRMIVVTLWCWLRRCGRIATASAASIQSS